MNHELTAREALVSRDDLVHALQWALSYIAQVDDEPQPGDGEIYEDYSGATRLAWPDQPENWS